jgi:hypothetical protein
MLTTNQLKTFAASNQYIQHYLKLTTWHQSRHYSKLSRTPSIFYHQQDRRSIEYDINTFEKNEAYFYAHREVKQRFGTEGSGQILFKFNIEGDEIGFFRAALRWNIKGEATILVSSYSTETATASKLPYIGELSYSVKYRGILSEAAAEKFIKQHIERNFLYSAGKWRAIQTENLYTKQRVKETYKYYLENYSPKYYQAYDESEMIDWLKRHKNLKECFIQTEKAVDFFKTHKKFRFKMNLEAYDFSWIYDFEGDVEEIEQEFQETTDNETVYI